MPEKEYILPKRFVTTKLSSIENMRKAYVEKRDAEYDKKMQKEKEKRRREFELRDQFLAKEEMMQIQRQKRLEEEKKIREIKLRKRIEEEKKRLEEEKKTLEEEKREQEIREEQARIQKKIQLNEKIEKARNSLIAEKYLNIPTDETIGNLKDPKYLGTYYPKTHNYSSHSNDTLSKDILILKDKDLPQNIKDEKANLYSDRILEDIKNEIENIDIILTVPSSDPNNINRGIDEIAQKLFTKANKAYSYGVLYRNKIKIAQHLKKMTTEEHLETLSIRKNIFYNKNILILDDVYTTGTSIKSCAILLLAVGANNIFPYTLSKTYG